MSPHIWRDAPLVRRWALLPPRTKRFIVAALLAFVVIVAVALFASRRDGSAAAGRASGGAMNGTAGMNASAGGSVALTAGQIRQFGITFGTVELRLLTTQVRTAGVVAFDETTMSQFAPKFGGFAERVYVDFTGRPVRRGEPLLEVYSPELVSAQQELLLAGRLQRDIGKSGIPGVPDGSTDLVEAARRRLRLWDISDAQIDEVLRSGRPRRTLTLYAPASGVVTEKRVVAGQAFQAGEQLYAIADISNVWVDAELRESEGSSVRVGSGADLEFVGLPGRVFKGRVSYIYPTVQAESRTIRARITAGNSGGSLKPGMYATVRLMTPRRRALSVPTAAILRTGDRNVVFVDMGRGELMPHDVKLGSSADEFTEVLAGLEPGQRVVTSAQFILDSESNLAEVMRSMMGNQGSGAKAAQSPEMNDKGADMRGMEMKTPVTKTPDRR